MTEAVSITLVALARDCAGDLPDLFSFMTELQEDGVQVRAIVGENGSRDGTRQLLGSEASRNPALIVVDTGGMANIRDRLTRMAYGRDLLATTVREIADNGSFVIVIDVDGVLRQRPTASNIRNACVMLQQQPNIAAISASSRPYYYDLLALRAPGVYDENIGIKIEKARNNPFSYYLVHRYIYSKQREITRCHDMRCTSAFNGLCIYRSADYLSGSYSDELPPNVCEHVPFNQAMCAEGDRIIVISPDIQVQMPATHGPVGTFRFYANRIPKLLARLRRSYAVGASR